MLHAQFYQVIAILMQHNIFASLDTSLEFATASRFVLIMEIRRANSPSQSMNRTPLWLRLMFVSTPGLRELDRSAIPHTSCNTNSNS